MTMRRGVGFPPVKPPSYEDAFADDLSVWEDLVFLTVNRTLQGTSCDGTG